MKIKSVVLAAFFSLVSAYSFCYPVIKELQSRNPVFAQYQQEVEEGSKALATGKTPYLNFYEYTAADKDTVNTMYARCSITYDTLVSANRIESNEEPIAGKTILLPTINALFIPETPSSPLEILLSKEYSVMIQEFEDALKESGGEKKYSKDISKITLNGQSFYFLPGKRFSGTTRGFYLSQGMRLPLEKSVLTSDFGMRTSPISGKWKMHKGIDMAAPQGTKVMACKNGKVEAAVKNDYVYGNYIILRHDNNTTSLYAHLSKISVEKDEVVKTGQKIGEVGTTGLSTGPHLHFEIRVNGTAKNPSQFIR